ncbi:hypothetical protein [Macrococcus sp. DPC7161]|uniref:hypothetical protein n=1 Tax=Macrococcus sp. DPC7161 TaxID=2507060 RepID=UPI00100AB4EE|nr:hypothetical protein [Macrococcus sp. DPC7161]RXK18927.1 hypothetical protein ER639_01055 [Macrococcus sp. DPC7161]
MDEKRLEILDKYKKHFGTSFPNRKFIRVSNEDLEKIIDNCIRENKTYTTIMREKYGKDIML